METVGLSCPVSGIQTNETVVRLVAAQVLVSVGISAITGFYWLTAFVLLDFALRAFANGKGSLLKFSAKRFATAFKLMPKPTDEAPKLFAARVGFVVLTAMLVFQVTGQSIMGSIAAVGIITFAFLESIFAFCVGCVLYQFLAKK